MKNTILQNLLRSLFALLLLSGCGADRAAINYRGAQEVQYSKLPPARPQQPPVPAQYYYNPYVAPQYAPAQTYQKSYRAPQTYGYPPASRAYSDPYSFQPQTQYPYYDSDHYYVPPNYYGAAPDSGALDPNNL